MVRFVCPARSPLGLGAMSYDHAWAGLAGILNTATAAILIVLGWSLVQ